MYQGVVAVKKERGFTSFDVVAVCRKIFQQKAVGHTGTLDPMAEGVLPVCLGRATKLCDMLQSKDKSYNVTMELGYSTDTDDSTGTVLSRSDSERLASINEDMLRDVLGTFLGEIMQVPPRYAAIKKDGKKLYEYARSGVEVEIPPRPVTIYKLDILSVNLPVAEFRVHCSKGTYIRSICRDVGERLGTGAVMTGLVRESTGRFLLEQCHTLQELRELRESGELDSVILPMDTLLSGYPVIHVRPDSEKLLRNGNPMHPEDFVDLSDPGGMYRVYLGDRLAALYEYDPSRRLLMNRKMLMTEETGSESR